MEIKYITNNQLIDQAKERYLESSGRTKAVIDAIKESEEPQEIEVRYLMSKYENETLANEDDLKIINQIAHELEHGRHMPPIIATGHLHVVDGIHHLLAAKKMNIYIVPVLILDLNE